MTTLLVVLVAPLLLAADIVPVVANGRINYTGQITDEVRRSATEVMLKKAVVEVAQESFGDKDPSKLEEFTKKFVEKNPGKYVDRYKILAEIKGKRYFQLTGKVDVKKSILEEDFNSFVSAEEPQKESLSLVLLVSEFDPRNKIWNYWWKMPAKKKQRLYFTRQLGKELEAKGVLAVDKIGKERILLQNSNYQTPFITTDAAIQLGSIYRVPFVVTGNVHLSEESGKKKYLVASLQVLSTENGEDIAEIIEKKKVRSVAGKSVYTEMARLVAPRIIDEMNTYLARTTTSEVSPGIVSTTTPQNTGEYLVTIEISNMNSLHPVELLEKYFTTNDSPVTEIKSLILEHRKALMTIMSQVDGTILARKIMSAFPNDDEFSVLSSSEDTIKIECSYSGIL